MPGGILSGPGVEDEALRGIGAVTAVPVGGMWRYCIKITGSKADGPYSYTVDYSLNGTEEKMIKPIGRSGGVKDIRIALLDA